LSGPRFMAAAAGRQALERAGMGPEEIDKIRRGDHVVLCASGGGIAMGAAVVRWTL